MVKLAVLCVITVSVAYASGDQSGIKTKAENTVEARSSNPYITIVDMNGESIKNLQIFLKKGSTYDSSLKERVESEIVNVDAVYLYADCNPKPTCMSRLDDYTRGSVEPRKLKSGEEIKLYVVTKQGAIKKKGI